MRRHGFILVAGVASMMLSACAIRTWTPAPGKDPAELSRDSGRCELYAQGSEPDTSFEATGSARNVAIASGVMPAVGGVATAARDADAYNNCMEAAGWIPADRDQQVATLPAAPQPVTATPLPALQGAPPAAGPAPLPVYATAPPPDAEQRAAQARAEQAWVSAQRVMNTGSDRQRRSLYGSLCGAGDGSACLRAAALSR